MKYEPSDLEEKDKITAAGFILYLNDSNQHLMDPKLLENVYQDMDLPLQNYYINSSHNTFVKF